MEPKWEMRKSILTFTVEYADFGGEENFVTEEDVLAETFSEGERILANYLEGRDYRVVSVCWKKMVIGEAAEHQMQRTAETVRHGVDCRCVLCLANQVVNSTRRR